MSHTVIVLHNYGKGAFWAYEAEGADLRHAHTFPVTEQVDAGIIVTQLADRIYEMCNLDVEDLDGRLNEDQIAQVVQYRARKNRSLSSGDVIVLMHGEAPVIALACGRVGWEPLESAEAILASVDLSDVDNHLHGSLSYRRLVEMMSMDGDEIGRALLPSSFN